jgi:hypothetical protein
MSNVNPIFRMTEPKDVERAMGIKCFIPTTTYMVECHLVEEMEKAIEKLVAFSLEVFHNASDLKIKYEELMKLVDKETSPDMYTRLSEAVKKVHDGRDNYLEGF